MTQSLGFIVGFVLVLFIALAVNIIYKKKNGACEYDERQLLERGNAFKYGFFAMLISLVALLLINESGFVTFGISFGSMITIAVGLVVYAVYSIMKDAYLNLNTTNTRYTILIGAVGICNLASGILAAIEDGIDFTSSELGAGLNLICGIMLFIVFVALIVKRFIPEEDD